MREQKRWVESRKEDKREDTIDASRRRDTMRRTGDMEETGEGHVLDL